MRGIGIADGIGAKYIPLERFEDSMHFDIIILVKYHGKKARMIRSGCDRLIYDPLDCWSAERWDRSPEEFWKRQRRELGFDDIIATSPACQYIMQDALPSIPVHMFPHHADPRIGKNWYNPIGPIVYAGGEHFIREWKNVINKTCDNIPRNSIMAHDAECWKALKGASIGLHLRMPPTDTAINRYCKPQVKLENIAAAGLAAVVTGHPCATSLRPGMCFVNDPTELHEHILAAAKNPEKYRIFNPVTLESHIKRMKELCYND